MGSGKKEILRMFVGLGMTLIGCVWFLLSVAGLIGGLAMAFGFPFGIGMAISGLIVAGIYLFRWQRIRKLLLGENVLVKWTNGESQTIIAPTCAYVDNVLYLWGGAGTRLEDVQIEQRLFLGSERSHLNITLGEVTNARSITGSRLWRTRNLSILIPVGQESAAQTVLDQLKSRLPAQS
jgi:hypothetical protein